MAVISTHRFLAAQLARGRYKPLPPASHHSRPRLSSNCRRFSNYLVSPRELNAAMKMTASTTSFATRIIPLCAAWFPTHDPKGRTGDQAFREERIPKARFFDLDKVIDAHPPYPHMLPSARGFSASLSELGIRKEDTLIVYDTKELGIFSAPKVGWMLKTFGHPKVHILNNFRVWVAQGLPTEPWNVDDFEHCVYPIPTMDTTRLASFGDIRDVSADYAKEGREASQILDFVPSDQISEMYPCLRHASPLGHIPNSIVIPCDSILDPETKAFLSSSQLRKLFETKGVDLQRPIISIGTGITAYIVDTALEEAKFRSSAQRVYDGSWK